MREDITTVHFHWSELKERFLRAKREGSWSSQPALDEMARLWKNSPDNGAGGQGWEGGSANETEDWLTNGYFADDFQHAVGQDHNIQTTTIVWNEDEGDPDVTRMICGYDDIFLGVLQAPSQSGIKILFQNSFNCGTPASVIREYGAFCAGLINSLMESGFDVEIDIYAENANLFQGSNEQVSQMVRVKEFGELLDFTSFSALFAPTGFRHLMFSAMAMSGDKLGKTTTSYLGRSIANEWKLEWDEMNRVITIKCDANTQSFPAREMYEQAYESGLM